MTSRRRRMFWRTLSAMFIVSACSAAQQNTNGAQPDNPVPPGQNLQQQNPQQQTYGYKPAKYIPPDSMPFMFDFGAGLGIPYGAFGLKGSVGLSPVGFPGGINIGCSAGWLPFANDFFFNPTVELMLLDRFKQVRPKLTFAYSKGTAVIMIIDVSSFSTLFYKAYPGFGTYAGVDWRPFKTLPVTFDFNIGWLFHSVSKQRLLSDYKHAIDSLIAHGWSMETNGQKIDPEKQVNSMYTPKISVGITLALRRTLRETREY